MTDGSSQVPGADRYPVMPGEERPAAPSEPSYPAPTHPGGPYAPAAEEGRPPRRGVGWWALLVAGLMGGLVGAGAVAGVLYLYPAAGRLAGDGSPSENVRIVTRTTAAPFQAVAEKVTPSVVNVSVQQRGVNPFTGRMSTQIAGEASGIVIRSDGHILTNYHVVEGADGILVRIGSDEVEAKLVGADPESDLAVIKVEHEGLRAAEIGESTSLKVGDEVVAVGSPFGLDKTVTSGIISALGRSNLADAAQGGSIAAYTNLIQTDAAINPGNSGGALADMEGRVVGVNTLIESPSGSVGAPQSAGIGFAIPIEFAMRIAEQLIETGKAEHPFMGVSMATVDEPIAEQLGYPDARGAYVDSVVPGSAAEAAGLKRGDIMTKIGGKKVESVNDAFAAIRSHDVGDVVEVELLRDGKPMTVQVTLGSDASR